MKFLISGFGHAGKAYAQAIEKKFKNAIIYVNDIDTKIYIPKRYLDLRFEKNDFYDLAIIATPPSYHLESLKSIIHHSGLVILEKPISTNIDEHQEIMELAEEKGNIYFSFHALFGKELSINDFKKEFGNSTTIKISHLFFDPYGDNTKKHLGGPFWDSIYNIASIFYGLFKQPVSIDKVSIRKDSFNVFEADITYKLGSVSKTVSQSISIRWDMPVNLKVSQLILDKNAYTIDHSSQSITEVNGLNHRYISFETSRLEAHYSAVIEKALKHDSFDENIEIAKILSNIVWRIEDAR